MKCARKNYLSRSSQVVSLFCIVLLSGCGLTANQRAAVKEFAAATADFSTLAADEFSQSRADVIEMNSLRINLGDPAIKRDDPLDQYFTVERVKARIDSLNALKEYAQLLSTLATSSNQGELQSASDSFTASLRKIKGVTLEDAQAGAIRKGVAAVGGLIVEQMRLDAVKSVVETAHPSIQKVIELVAQDFDPEADHWSLGYDTVRVALNGRARDVAAHPAGVVSVSDNSAIANAISLSNHNASRRKEITDQMMGIPKKQVPGLVAKLREAEKNLRQVAKSNASFEDIQQYASQVQDFVTIYQVLRPQRSK